jgi:BASS family bile acid:Na+ symporter
MTRILNGLAWIGRHGTEGFALSIFLGLALPQFAAAARPMLAVSIFCFVTITFARVDSTALRALVAAPKPLFIAAAWLVIAPPALAALGIGLVGRANIDPGLVLGLAVLGGAPPIMSAPAIAMLFGFEATLVITAILATTILAPLSSPLLAAFVAGGAVPLDLTVLIWRLVLLIVGPVLVAGALRRFAGEERLRARKASLDGFGVVMYFVFAVAAMDGVLAAAVADPARVARFLGVAFAMALAGFAAAWVVLRPLSGADRFVLGYATGQRNMGLIIAALGAATPDTTFLFFALAQFPIYLMPQVIKPIARRLAPLPAPEAHATAPP